jgi:hypothetical protein
MQNLLASIGHGRGPTVQRSNYQSFSPAAIHEWLHGVTAQIWRGGNKDIGGKHSSPVTRCYGKLSIFDYTVTIEPAGVPPMPLTNAEKQRAYRERHLGIRGGKTRIQLFLSTGTRAQLRRLARRKGYTVTALVEELVASAERRVIAKLSGRALKVYYGGE